jgi:hypothetical protein
LILLKQSNSYTPKSTPKMKFSIPFKGMSGRTTPIT